MGTAGSPAGTRDRTEMRPLEPSMLRNLFFCDTEDVEHTYGLLSVCRQPAFDQLAIPFGPCAPLFTDVFNVWFALLH